MPLQNLHISENIETINIKKDHVTFSRSEFQSLPSVASLQTSLQVKADMMLWIRHSSFPLFSLAAEEQILLYHAFQNQIQSM